eukprot:114929-Alexandrium_andersonii.AAC.1
MQSCERGACDARAPRGVRWGPTRMTVSQLLMPKHLDDLKLAGETPTLAGGAEKLEGACGELKVERSISASFGVRRVRRIPLPR